MKNEVHQLLKKHSIRQTTTREAVLNVMFSKNYAVSHAEIEKEMGAKFDRVTIYRTLNAFLENGLVHKVLDSEGGIKYAVCQHEHQADKHTDNHLHFKCNKCHQTLCLEDHYIPNIATPKNYTINSLNILAEGVCEKCNLKK